MLFSDDSTDPEEADAISTARRLENAGRNIGRAGSNGLSLLKDAGYPHDGIILAILLSSQMDEFTHSHERELRALMIASFDGDAGAYHQLLERLTSHLRPYYRQRFAQSGMVRRKRRTSCKRR